MAKINKITENKIIEHLKSLGSINVDAFEEAKDKEMLDDGVVYIEVDEVIFESQNFYLATNASITAYFNYHEYAGSWDYPSDCDFDVTEYEAEIDDTMYVEVYNDETEEVDGFDVEITEEIKAVLKTKFYVN